MAKNKPTGRNELTHAWFPALHRCNVHNMGVRSLAIVLGLSNKRVKELIAIKNLTPLRILTLV